MAEHRFSADIVIRRPPEVVFGWEGMGRFLYEGLIGPVSPDVNVVLGWMMIAATAVVIFNVIADLLYAMLDPRIRYA